MNISEKLKAGKDVNEYSSIPSFVNGKLNIEITNACNEDCVYCLYASQGLHKNKRYIDKELFFRVTREAYDLGITDVGLYMGGEPFMNPDIYEYVAYLKKEIGFKYVYISTNGIMCTPKKLEKIVQSGIDSIKFSVSSSNRENFKKHHGVDAFELVRNNIQYAYEYREKNKLSYKLFMFSIMTKYNIEEKEDIEKTYGKYVDELIYSDVIDSMIEMKGLKEYLLINKQKPYIAEGGRKIPCPQLFNHISIDEKGYLCCCCLQGYDITKVADLHKITLKEAVFGEEMINLRKRHLNGEIKNTICNRCVYHVKETIEPLTNKYCFQPLNVEYEDREEEIKKRFHINES